ncbi:MAG: hypothetical protein WC792_00660 [Candidatus Micrarchaeia archaeon]|jgi:hypothetical protein
MKSESGKTGFFERLVAKSRSLGALLVFAAALVLAALVFSRGQVPEGLQENAPVVSAVPTASPAPAPFYPSLEFEAKVFLVKKYGPSVCFGKPAVPSDSDVEAFLSTYPPDAVREVKRRFGAATDFQAWERITQIGQVWLLRDSVNSFSYRVEDGQCCSVAQRYGKLSIGDGFADQPAGVQQTRIPC